MIAIYGIRFRGEIVYVGQTTKPPHVRFNAHISHARCGKNQCPKLYRHMRENDLTGYSIEILDVCDDADGGEKEIHWIDKFGTFINGLNSHPGGNQARGDGHYSYGRAPIKAIMASVNARRGKKHSPEHVEKIRAAHLGRKQPQNYIPIICDQNGKTYESMLAASKDLGINKRTISAMLKGELIQTFGFTFKYADPDREKNRIIKTEKPTPDDGYEKMKKAARDRVERDRLNPLVMSKRLSGIKKYIEENGVHNQRKVIRSDGVEYKSVADAGRDMVPNNHDTGRSAIKRCLKNGYPYKGFTFRYKC